MRTLFSQLLSYPPQLHAMRISATVDRSVVHGWSKLAAATICMQRALLPTPLLSASKTQSTHRAGCTQYVHALLPLQQSRWCP